MDSDLPASQLPFLPRLMFVLDQVALLPAEVIDHDGPRPEAPPPGVTRQYGKYLVRVGLCMDCHGAGLSGGRIPGLPPNYPPAANLTPAGIGEWTEEDFFRALRTGIRPDGTLINPFMPWGLAGRMTDAEIKAVWLYLRSVPPRPTGNR